MFTGLIQGVGALARREPRGGDARLRFDAGTLPFADVLLGESIAVNGVCLTVVAFDAAGFEADASNETLALTSLGRLGDGAPVNLERALRAGDRLGGHLVSGHVDGVGRVLDIRDDARAQRWRFSMPAALSRYVAQKGSVCVDGVSLTVNGVDADGFDVALVPHTVAHTAFSTLRTGDAVNLEVDLVARYVERLLSAQEASDHRPPPFEKGGLRGICSSGSKSKSSAAPFFKGAKQDHFPKQPIQHVSNPAEISMSFSPIPELLEELRAGRMVVIVDDEDRENEGDLIMAAELVRPTDVNFMVTHARGLVCLSLTRERCAQLGLPPMVQANTSSHHTNFTVSIEAAEGVTTGISAYDRAHTIRTAVRPDAQPRDLAQPGHIFPLAAQPGGVLSRAGHTEAAADLAMLAGLEPAGVLVEILNADGSMARRPQLEAFAHAHGLKIGSIEDLIRHRLETEHTVERVDRRAIETAHGAFELTTYRDRLSHGLHLALMRGEPDRDVSTLARVQLHNPLADALHWRRADFGPAAGDVLAAIDRAGRGVLVLLGDVPSPDALLARIRAPLDAVNPESRPAAAARGGALAEWRRNGAGSQILADLGLGRLRVLGTPRKQVGLAGFGLEVVEYVDAG